MPKATLSLFLFAATVGFTCIAQNATTKAVALAAGPSPEARTFLQWTEMKGKRTQVFIDAHTTSAPAYRGVSSQVSPSFMIQLPGDGSVDLLEYVGNGDDWKWTAVAAHISLTHPSPSVDRVEFDRPVFTQGHDPTVVFRSLDDEWKVVASSKPLPWHPS